MKNFRKLVLALIALCLGFACFERGDVFAAENTGLAGLSVSPTIQRSGNLEPGTTYTNRLLIENNGEKPFDFHMTAEPYSVENITYAPIYSVKNAFTQIVNWITFNDYKSHLEPGESSEVVYTVNVPEDVPGGGQYAIIFAETDNLSSSDESIKTTAKAGTILVARINGDTRLTGEIKKTSIPMFLLAPPVSATAMFENSGNVDADARMTLKIEKYITGELIYDGSADPLEKTILPDTTRELTVSWANVPRLGILKVTLNTEFMGDAEVKTRIVLVCPIWFMALIVLIILVIVARILARKREDARTRANSRNAAGSSQKFNL